MKPSKIRAIFALTLVLAMLTLGVRSFAASSPAKVSLDLKFAELAEVFRVLAQVGGSNIVVSPAVTGKITVKLTNVPFEEALDIISSVSGLEYIYMNGTIMVGPKGTLIKLMDKAVVEKIELLYISATDAATKLSFAIPGIAAQPDDKSGTLLIRGNQSDIILAKAFLAKVDTPLPITKMTISEEEVIDIIQLSNAEAQGVYDAVSKLLKASLAVDTRLNAILAGGKLTDVKAARSIIEKLDIVKKLQQVTQPVEIRVIQLSNAAATDVRAAAALIIPADRIQADAKSNTLIIKATPEEFTRVSELVKSIEAATPKVATVAEVKEQLEVVTLLYAKATDVAEAMTVVLPANKIAIDERTNKIVMLVDAAKGAEAIALIKALDVKVADVTVQTVAAPILRLGYYSPVYAKALDIEAVVKLVASGAKLQVIESNNSLVAYGTDADHALIAEALKKLDEEALSVKKAAAIQPAASMEVIELKHAMAADVQKALASVLPAENVTIDERTNKVLLKVTPVEMMMAMEIIGAIDVKVDQQAVVAIAPGLEVMNLTYAKAADAKKVLDGVLGAEKVNIDERTNKVIIMGTPDERALAAQIIKNLDIEMASLMPKPSVSSLEVFQLKYAQVSDVQKALAAVIAPSGISIDERTNKVIIMGTPDERELAAQIIRTLDIDMASLTPKPAISSLVVIQLKYAQVADVQKALAAIIAPSSISIDERTNKLLLKITPEEKQLAMSIVNEMDVRVDVATAQVEIEGLEIIELKFAKAADVKPALEAALGQGKVSVDERSNKVLIIVTPSKKQLAMSIIGAIDVPIAVIAVQTVEQTLEMVQLKYAIASEVKKVLDGVLGAANVNIDERTNKLLLKVTPEEKRLAMAVINELDVRIDAATSPVEVESLEVVELKFAKAADAKPALDAALGQGKVSIDERSNKVLMIVTSSKKQLAMSIINAIDVPIAVIAVKTIEPTIEIIQLKYSIAADVKKVMDGVLGAVNVNIDERTNKLLLKVTPEEKQLAMAIINELDVRIDKATVPVEVENLEVVELKFAKAADVKPALDAALGQGKVSIDERSNKVLMIVTSSKKQLAMSIISAIDVPIAVIAVKTIEPTIEMIQLKYSIAADVKKVMDGVLGSANVSIDERTNKLLLKVTPEEKQLAMAIINELDTATAPVEVESLEVVELKFAKAADAKPALDAALGQGKVSIDERSNKVLMIVTSSKKQLAMSIISAIDVPIALVSVKTIEPTIEMIQLKYSIAADVKKILDGVLGAANVNIDERTNKLLLKVTPEEKQLAMAIINELDVRIDTATAPVEVESLEVVELKFAKAADVKPALDAALGQGKVSIDERSNKVLMIVTSSKKQLAMSIISAIDVPIAVIEIQTVERALEMIQLKYAVASEVKKVLDGVLGSANVSIDERTNKLLLKVTPEEKPLAMAVINELDVRIDTAAAPVEVESLEVVELKFAKAADVKPALDAALGQGKVSVDERSNKVLIIVTPSKKQLVMSIIGAIDVPIAETVVQTIEPTLEMIQLKYAVASDVKKVLDGVLGAANVNIDERTNKIIVMVTPAGKTVALDIIGNLDVEVAPKFQPVVGFSTGVESLQIVQLKYAPAVEVGKALEAVISVDKVNVDARTNKIIMNVTDEEFSKAKAIIAELDIRLEGEVAVTSETVQMGFYKLYNVKPSDIEASVKVVAGEAKVQAADQTSSITAYGTSTELKMIESLIAKLDVVPIARGVVATSVVETLEVVQLTNATAADVRASLSVLLPESKVSINERTNKVMMIVTPELKSQAMTIIAALDVPVAQSVVLLSDPVRLGFFQLKYASAKDMEAPVKLVASGAKVQVAERTNSMIVYGTESELALIEEVISKLDVDIKTPADISEALAEYKTYKLNNASPTEISSALAILLPASSMFSDDRSGTLIIKAVPELQKLAADVITTLDVKSVSQVTVDADASVTRVYKLNHAEPADLKAALGEVTTGKVSIDVRTSSLIITAKASEQAQLVEIIDQLDQELAQVFFEASLYELSGDATKRLGIDWTINKLVFGYNTLSQLATVSLDFDNKIAALATEGKAKLISKQHTYTVDGKAGRMLIGDRIPVIVQNVEQGQVVNTVEYINAGIELTILAKVSYDGSITAEVKPIISSIIGWTPQNYPQIRTRELETIVTVKNGESAIIGGLFSQEEIETITKVPILGDIPLIKELFTKRGTDVKDQEIIIVITAWIIKPGQTTGIKDGIVEIKGPVL